MPRPNGESCRRRAGFSLVELAVVIVVIGVLSAFGVPRFLKSAERSKAAEAFEYLTSVRTAQARYLAQYGTYAADLANLEVKCSPPRDFFVPAAFTADAETPKGSWSLTLTRTGPPSSYGAYTVAFTEAGFDEASSTITRGAAADINPINN